MRALVLGDKSQSNIFFREQDVEYVNQGPFDAILLASHLQIVRRKDVTQVIAKLYDELSDGGRIIVTVPSLEWACRQIATQNDVPLNAYVSIYGTGEEPYLSGFTMLWLRRALEEAGFIILEARTESFRLRLTFGDQPLEDKAKQHVVIAVKRQPDPQKALEWLNEVPSN